MNTDAQLIEHSDFSKAFWYVIPGQGDVYLLSYKFNKEDVMSFVKDLMDKTKGPISYRIQQNVGFMSKSREPYVRKTNLFDFAKEDTLLYSPLPGQFSKVMVVTPYVIKIGQSTPDIGSITFKFQDGTDIIEVGCTPEGKNSFGRAVLSWV